MKSTQTQSNRWFIWTIVFLVVAGVSLVTYINYSAAELSTQAVPSFVVHHQKPVQTLPKRAPVPLKSKAE